MKKIFVATLVLSMILTGHAMGGILAPQAPQADLVEAMQEVDELKAAPVCLDNKPEETVTPLSFSPEQWVCSVASDCPCAGCICMGTPFGFGLCDCPKTCGV